MARPGLRLLIAILLLDACRSADPPIDVPTTLLPDGAKLGDTVTVGDDTWFVVVHEYQTWLGAVVCHLVSLAVRCAIIPGTTANKARLLDAEPGTVPLLAIPADGGTLYVEPFTWTVIRRLPDVTFDRHGVVLRDGTLWIEDSFRSLLLIPPRGTPSRWLGDVRILDVSVSPAGAFWTEHRGDPAVSTSHFMTAGIGSNGLGPAREIVDLEPWSLFICHAGSTVGFVELRSNHLVMLDLQTDAIRRIELTDHLPVVHCRPGTVAVTNVAFMDAFRDVAWCDTTGCRTGRAWSPLHHYPGTFTVVDGGVLAVAGDLENLLMTWRIGTLPHTQRLPGPVNLGRVSSAPLPNGALVVFDSGPILILDHAGQRQPVELTWWGPLPSY